MIRKIIEHILLDSYFNNIPWDPKPNDLDISSISVFFILKFPTKILYKKTNKSPNAILHSFINYQNEPLMIF